MGAITLERLDVTLKKAVPVMLNLSNPVYHLDNYRFKVFHSFSKPLHLRFTFFDEQDQPSVYHVLDIFDGVLFDIYAVTSDTNKIFEKLEIHSEVDVLLKVELFREEAVVRNLEHLYSYQNKESKLVINESI